MEIKSQRFDRDLAALDTNDLGTGLQELKNQYPEFLDLYLDRVMGFRVLGSYANENPAISEGLRSFLTEKDYRGLFDTVEKHYPDTKSVEKELKKGFQYMKYYFPNYKEPNITYFVSGLANWGAFLYGEHSLAIGLDMFLGKDYPFYRSVGLQDYLNVYFREEYIPVAALRNVYQEMYPDTLEDKNLLELMIQRGKEYYFLSKVLPFVPEDVRLGYTPQQLEDITGREAFIYNFFVQKDLLYSTSVERIFSFVHDGPGTPEISDQCPGNIGSWIGYRIILAYMKQRPDTRMQDLFANKDAKSIFIYSKYKPE